MMEPKTPTLSLLQKSELAVSRAGQDSASGNVRHTGLSRFVVPDRQV